MAKDLLSAPTLQCGRDQLIAECAQLTAERDELKTLQCGRDQLIAEWPLAQRKLGQTDQLQCGRDQLIAECIKGNEDPEADEIASMWPRSADRGM